MRVVMGVFAALLIGLLCLRPASAQETETPTATPSETPTTALTETPTSTATELATDTATPNFVVFATLSDGQAVARFYTVTAGEEMNAVIGLVIIGLLSAILFFSMLRRK